MQDGGARLRQNFHRSFKFPFSALSRALSFVHFACSDVDARVSAEKEYAERKAELKEAKELAQLREKAEREVVAPAASAAIQTQATKAPEAKKPAKPAPKKAPTAAKKAPAATGMRDRGREGRVGV